jgi:hypothetical protein
MKKPIVMLFILMGVISVHAQGRPTGAGTHTPIIHSNESTLPANSTKKTKKAKNHSNRRSNAS